jgi:hypothetical protein
MIINNDNNKIQRKFKIELSIIWRENKKMSHMK